MITSNKISLKQGDDVINNEGKVMEFFSNAYTVMPAIFLLSLLQTSSTPVLVQVRSLISQKEPQLHLLIKVVLISIFTQTTDLLLF